jgi:hypothetical protein
MPELPPILRTPGLRLIGISSDNGWTHFHFESKRPKREVMIAVSGHNVRFTYTMIDAETHTLISYHGPHGDPERDEISVIGGIE